jgi:hypothetical protein
MTPKKLIRGSLGVIGSFSLREKVRMRGYFHVGAGFKPAPTIASLAPAPSRREKGSFVLLSG